MLPNILKVMSEAIRDRNRVAIRYHGQREIRVLEPHAIYSNERGELVVDGFQVKGYSAANHPLPYWRPFRLKKIAAVSRLKETFTPRVDAGFAANKARYRKGLVAIVEGDFRNHTYPVEVLQQMGPQLPVRTFKPY